MTKNFLLFKSQRGSPRRSEQTVFTPVGAKQCIRLRCLRHLSEQCLFAPFYRALQECLVRGTLIPTGSRVTHRFEFLMVGFRIEESKNRIPKYKGAAFGVIRWLRLFLLSNNFTRTPTIIVPFTKSLQNFLRFFCEKVPS